LDVVLGRLVLVDRLSVLVPADVALDVVLGRLILKTNPGVALDVFLGALLLGHDLLLSAGRSC
jgi:hypothetical protein